MHSSIAGHNLYNLFILTKDYSNYLNTKKLLTIEHMVMFLVKSFVIQINCQVYVSINWTINLKKGELQTAWGKY